MRLVTWLVFTIASAFLIGFYDFFKKLALRVNAVMPVLLSRICAAAVDDLVCGAVISRIADGETMAGRHRHPFLGHRRLHSGNHLRRGAAILKQASLDVGVAQ